LSSIIAQVETFVNTFGDLKTSDCRLTCNTK
jgi:hypothetical protein